MAITRDTVPDAWKRENGGPWIQAPEEYGGKWWQFSPFTGEEPWKTQGGIKESTYPENFIKIFGERPKYEDFHGQPQAMKKLQIARVGWDQELKYYKPVRNTDPRIDTGSWMVASEIYGSWGVLEIVPFEDRYGLRVALLGTGLEDYDVAYDQAINYPHHTIAQFQIRMAQEGLEVPKFHPFVPPHLIRKDTEE